MARRLSQVKSRGVARRRRRKFPCGDSNGESRASGGGGGSPSSRDLPSNKKIKSPSLVCGDVRSMYGPAAGGDFLRPVTQMADGESSRRGWRSTSADRRPPTFPSLTHLVVCRMRGFLLRSKVKPPSLVGVGEARSTRGTKMVEKMREVA